MWDSIFTNIFGDSETNTSPDAKGDYYFITDAQNDFNYREAKLCDALIALSCDTDNEYQILYGGEVTNGGSGTVNIAECVAISVDADGNKRIVHLPAQTALTLPTGYDDGNKIWAILKYDFKLGSSTRNHKSGTSYHYTLQDTFYGDPTGDEGEDTSVLFTQTDPTGTAVILGTFTMTAADVFSLLSDRSPCILEKGAIPTIGNSSIGKSFSWNKLQKLLQESIDSGSLFPIVGIVSTYNIVYPTAASNAYWGGILSPDEDIHHVPYSASVGQKINSSGVVSTYSLVYTTTNAYIGGVLDPNGDIHFVPCSASVGQKISSSGVVSTYSLVYTTTTAYGGGILSSNGDIHFVPRSASVGQKISSSGVVSTYSLVYTTTTAYMGGVLASDGNIHFIPYNSPVGQKISSSGVISTYSLVYTTTTAYSGGVLAPNGDIHFVPCFASVGQKISSSGVVSTYSLVFTGANAYRGGVLAPTGTIHLIPCSAPVGQKIFSTGVVSTYSLVYTTGYAYSGGILKTDGKIYFVANCSTVGQKISVPTGKPWSLGMCLLPHFNKF